MNETKNRAAKNIKESTDQNAVMKGLSLLKGNPAAAKAMTRTVQEEGKKAGLPQQEIDQVKKDINNPAKLDMLEVQAAAGNPQSTSGAFTMALATFLPAIVGGLVGGEEGAAGALGGALEGAKAGVGIAKDIQTMELERTKAMAPVAPKPGAFQQVRNVATKSGKPVTFDSALNQYVYANTSQPVPANDLVSKVSEGLDLAKERISLQKMQLDFQKIKQEALQKHRDEPSSKIAGEIGLLNYVLDITDSTEALKKDVETGFFINIAEGVKGAFGKQDPKFQALKGNTIDMLAQYVKSISGAAVTDEERAWLSKSLPNTGMDDKEFLSALNEYRRRVRVLIHRKVKAESDAGRDMSKFGVDVDSYLDPKFISKDYVRAKKATGSLPTREEVLKKIQYLENKRGAE